ncbi:hypothetical protein [Bythopirellula polymerisocia]|uniref:PEP-CTERM protein-sorting domain-containing protein n=1 Tax=Bythopirellula polymerisocia TaxID=2528003 RepID=A0A5C6CHN7_9BACT|nr:hypothetical protein [Bythopirellula polymerisocia]TWU22791.1 hypothetical protein Pla144_42520 [Bythopirellula polymerisocia]
MNRHNGVALAVLLGFAITASQIHAAITVTTDHGPNPNFDHTLFDGMLSNSDLIQGLIATELAADKGWHPANTNPADQLAAFTNGLGATGTLTGLLNDFPGEGVPTKSIQYDLSQAANIGKINILTGNSNDVDGRAFCTVLIRYSTDNGANFSPLGGFVPGVGANNGGYYQSDVPLTINEPGGAANSNLETLVSFMSIADDASPIIATGVTNLQFDFYATNNTVNWYWDPFDGVNPFSGFDDGQSQAISSPLVWEIDVIEGPSVSADFDMDGDVDGKDFLTWQRGFGINDGSAQPGDGDATGDGNVNAADLSVWQNTYSPEALIVSSVSVPEPATMAIACAAMFSLLSFGRCRSRLIGR